MGIFSKIMKVIFRVILVALFIVVMVISSVALGIVYTRYVDTSPEGSILNIFDTQSASKEKINVLVLGTNQTLTDFIVVAGYDPETGKVSILSIPRDTKYGKANTAYSKINAIYQGSKIDKLKTEVEEMLDIKIDNYIIFDKKALWEVVDALGGVTVDVGPKALKYSDPAQNLYINLQPGVQVLDGKKAEQYVRYRKGYADGDLGRIKAQQNFIKAFISECLKPTKIGKLPEVAKIGLSNVKTDITFDKITYYLEDVVKFQMENVQMEMIPGAPQTLDGASFFIPNKTKAKALANEWFNGVAPVLDTTSVSSSSSASGKEKN